MSFDMEEAPLKPGLHPQKRYIRTHTGKDFHFDDIAGNVVSMTDIAHALAHIGRFVGHTSKFYSVAEHCVRVSWACPQHPKWGLLHDASEAFLGDVSSPLKAMLPDYKEIERKVMAHICRTFHLQPGMPQEVHNADLMLLATEGRDLFANGWPYEQVAVAPLEQKIEPWLPQKAKAVFMDRYIDVRYKE